jgi:hypothetical protein
VKTTPANRCPCVPIPLPIVNAQASFAERSASPCGKQAGITDQNHCSDLADRRDAVRNKPNGTSAALSFPRSL